MRMRGCAPLHLRTYRLLLRVFPRDVRLADSEEMMRLFEHQYARARGLARWRLCLRAIVDAIRHGVAERIDRRFANGAQHSRAAARDAVVSGRWIDMFRQDARYALRLIVKHPGTALAIVLTLALGIGANSAVFSVVHAVLLRPLPYAQPDRLVMIWEKRPAEGVFNNVVSPADFLDWTRMATSFTGMAAYSGLTVDLTGVGDPVQLPAAAVTAPFFEVLGIRALHGRTFAQHEDVLGNHRVVVIGHSLWQQRFGGDLSAVGRRIDLNGLPHEIIGVLPATFEFPGGAADVWTPLVLRGDDAPPRASHWLAVYARLAPAVTLESARAEMDRIGRDLEAAYPNLSEGHGAHVVALGDEVVAPARNGLLVTMAAVAFLLLIACTNVANLLLARGAGRRREMAIRSAVGAARGRLLRQALTESIVMAALGAGAGLVLAWWVVRLIVSETPPALRAVGIERAQLDVPVLVFTAAVCVIAAVTAGLLPAWQGTREQPGDPLREGSRSPAALRRRLRFALIGTEVAVTVLLLIGAGLMIRSFVRVLSEPPGIEATQRLTLNLTLPRSRYANADALRAARRELDARFNGMPGVVAAGATSHLPMTGDDSRGGITVEGMVRTQGDAPVRAHPRFVTPRYFEAAGIELRRGRAFTDADNATAPTVVIINDTMARRYWPGQDPIGKRMRFNAPNDPWREVVGIVEDVKHWGLDREVNPEAYLPFDQVPGSRLAYVLHTEVEPTQVAAAVTAHVSGVDPNLPIGLMRTLEEVAARSVAARRWSALLLGLFAALGLLLAAAGIYGVLAHLVSMRTGEIGIRMTLGAHPVNVLRQVLGEALLQAGAGLVIGIALAVVAMRGLNAMLFDITPHDPLTFAGAALMVVIIALLAAAIPAIRAMRVDPVAALREN